ncbi:MAG: TetM/TetW/TetO/TetS family tetracycline resistance ribosomal protection protein [Clostridiales bacterium]|nr:TetM/TetW/TetO/TetS family tetracycline resistance ribosomal protection protein [Candidatus Cacconaster stercorequi]
MKKAILGILAHVDAGKTTLAEAMLYHTGALRKLGRVDHGSTALDTHDLERERGITIFSSQAQFATGELEVTLLDTPGHVDFSAETERTLQVLDYAVLVINGAEGVQAHTHTLWRLLALYQVPTFLFITKMDFARHSRDALIREVQRELDENCMDFSPDTQEARMEGLAMCREDLLERYLDGEAISDEDTAELIATRTIFPCYFGSGLKLDGIEEFLQGLERFVQEPTYPDAFGARVFKISRDAQGNRLTHLKITGGTLHVKDTVDCRGTQEKINQIRLYTGNKFITVDALPAGSVCAVTGLTAAMGGMGLGHEASAAKPVLEPVMNYRIVLPPDCDARTMLPKLHLLEEEDPLLRITWNEHLQEIHVGLMGAVQTEILKSLIAQRFGVEVVIDCGQVMYRETIEHEVEGVGHYEPLRHYAEVHLLLSPLPQGSGLVFDTACSEDVLDRNWQRLILTHLTEKPHLGVLTGSPITDMKITLAAGRAHIKHTEGGDFRQATYRAVRQGLMQAQSKLLEPYYDFRLEVPASQIGRAISDIRMRSGTFSPPEDTGEMQLLRGTAPVTTMNDYAAEVASYTGGRGRLSCQVAGYGPCHNPEEVIERLGYEAQSDLDNTPDSVFCAHGGGFTVKWDKVPEYMHLESCLSRPEQPYTPQVNRQNLHLDDKELEAIMEREFGPIRRPVYSAARVNAAPDKSVTLRETRRHLIVDGYNVIFAWDGLHQLAEEDLAAARDRLMDILCSWSAFTHHQVVLVFDGYKVPGGTGERFDHRGIHVVYTREHETGDMYIERLLQDIGKNEQVRVVTSDALIQLSAVRSGVLRMSAAEFEREVNASNAEVQQILREIQGRKQGIPLSEQLKKN